MRPSPLFLIVVAACGVSAGPPSFPSSTTAALTGAMCGAPGRPCRCAGQGESLGEVPSSKKRFELRLPQVSESSSAIEIASVGTLVRPAGARGDQCFYVDLDAGRSYAVTVHGVAARRERGLALGYTIREYNPVGRGFYTIVDQLCGDATAACPHADASDWGREYQNGHGGWDPCSSSRTSDYRAQGGFFEGHVTDTQLTFTLKVYRFTPDRLPGSERCPPQP